MKESQLVELLRSLRDSISQGKFFTSDHSRSPQTTASSSLEINHSAEGNISTTSASLDSFSSGASAVLVSPTTASLDSVSSGSSAVVVVSSPQQRVTSTVLSSDSTCNDAQRAVNLSAVSYTALSTLSSSATTALTHALPSSSMPQVIPTVVSISPRSQQSSLSSQSLSPLVTHQVPPINKFSGEDLDKEGETFQDWVEQFETIAQMCGWDDQAWLVNLTTHLCGQAYSFYRTCSPQQRSSYSLLKSQLKERFTPVRIQAVHSSLFHQRKQGGKETVDQYAQELRRLFYKAYPRENQGSGEAEGFGRSVLAHQFVAGLLPVLRSKVAGNEGDHDQLLIKARFEEVKIRDLASTSEGIPSSGILWHQGLSPNNRFSASNRMPRQDTMDRCYICNQPGHFARNCSLKGRGAPPESRGRTMPRGETIAANLNEEPASLPNVQDEIA